jgi:hypothetical protein
LASPSLPTSAPTPSVPSAPSVVLRLTPARARPERTARISAQTHTASPRAGAA